MYLIFKKLAQKEPKRILIVFFMMIITGFLDMASIGLLIPLLNSLFDSSMQIPFLTEFFVKLSLTMSKSEIIQLSLVLIFSTFLIKNIFILIFTKINTNFLGYLTVSFQQHVFRKYIDLPFFEIKKKNTSEYLRNIIQETSMLTAGFLAPALNLILNLITILFFFFLLVNVNFKISIFLLFFSLIIFLIFINIFKKIIENFGRRRQKYNLNATEYVKQTFDGFKELKISNKEDFFEGNFKRVLSKFVNMGVYRSVITVLPRAAIEVLMILVFTSIFFISVKMDNDLNKLFSVISFYVAAFFRILPNLTSMIRNYQKMNYSRSAFYLIEDFFELPDDKKNNSNIIDSKNEFIFENKIEFVDVSFAYKEKIIFENLNLKIDKNSIFGIQGDSGAGKSTFFDLFCGLNKPQKGQILVDSVNILNNERDWIKKLVMFSRIILFLTIP